MSNNEPTKIVNGQSPEGSSGQDNPFIYERLYIIFDDPFKGLQKKVKVDLAYADGTKVSSETDSTGEVEVSRNHGAYVDAEVSTDCGEWRRRVFILLPDPFTQNGAWQRLVNMGYVSDEQPSESPPSQIKLAMAVEEFQAEHQIKPTGKLEDVTLKSIQEAHDTEILEWHDRTWNELYDPSEKSQIKNPKMAIS
jgi:hypothetical protein